MFGFNQISQNAECGMVNYMQVTLIGLGIYVQAADNLHNVMVPN